MLGIASLPDRTALHFGSDGSPDVVGSRDGLIVLPLLALGGWLVSAITGFTGLPVLAGVKNAKVRAAVFPGMKLSTEGRIVQ